MNDIPLTSRLMHKLLAFFFKHLYHGFAWAYDLVAGFVSLGNWKKWILEILPLLQGSMILELGFGPGHLQAALLNKRLIAYGVDESIQMGRMTVRRLSRMDIKQSQRIVRARAEAIPYPGGNFETVVATFPTPFIFLPETITEIARVLRKDGKLVILLAAKPTGRNLSDRFITWLFAITGESPPDQISVSALTEPFTTAGLTADAAWLQGENCKLLVVTAIKT
jgi:ubiquinone/menaquinone biosynthesis C-methylase UbiE